MKKVCKTHLLHVKAAAVRIDLSSLQLKHVVQGAAAEVETPAGVTLNFMQAFL